MPPESQIYDCCDKGYNRLSHADAFTNSAYDFSGQGIAALRMQE